MTVPADVAAQTLRIATELPVSGGIRSGVWRPDSVLAVQFWVLWFHGRQLWVCDTNRNPIERGFDPQHRLFASWDEVRVALGEVEERGSWWPDPHE